MNEYILFYSVFAGQVLFISLVFPKIIVQRSRSVLRGYPPTEYPKLYPVSLPVIERKLTTYWHLNLAIAMAGLALLIMGIRNPNQEMLGWDNQSVTILYYFLQHTPVFFAEFSGFKYFKLMREADNRTRRSASLAPRRIIDFAQPWLIIGALCVYIAYVILVLVIRQNPFPGFAGFWNLAGATLLNLLYGAAIYGMVHGRKHDPHQTAEDRNRKITTGVKLMLLMSICGTLFMAVFLILGAMRKQFLIDIFIMVFFQLAGLVWVYTARIKTANFDVYRGEAGQ